MATRSKARRRALEVLFEADLKDANPSRILADRVARSQQMTAQDTDPRIGEYTIELVNGVVEHIDRIDSLIETYSIGWPLDRMPTVDRNVLRLGVFELLWGQDVPEVVAIDEAVSLAQELSTAESPQFVNGLLDRLRELKPTLQR
ncbi:transcription antitermination factor NusB [Actinocrinis puniceicyclus]|uniref:Transcription antitermination protein NusB n=1 Tax=Actinocrinis puniceicyclus TaxID=977794 RepID=A0A8J7WLZ1_9ACTN|nr:transcription antitermination factor NusB [Actinocrinis puniceicyclus]MBS2963708.1 transcription antitermination factor NusB [Actinocrinis puniceicyclus]